MDRRKHYSQMSPIERKYIYKHLERHHKWKTSDYANERRRIRNISRYEVRNCIESGYLIEAHNNKETELRVLLRLLNGRGTYTCVVLSLFDGDVITVYENEGDDNHSTIDMSQYKWDVDLVKAIDQMKATKKVKAWDTPSKRSFLPKTSTHGRARSYKQ